MSSKNDDDLDFEDDDFGLDDDLDGLGGDGFSEPTPIGGRAAVTSSLREGAGTFVDEFTDNKVDAALDIAKSAIPASLSKETEIVTDITSSVKEELSEAGKKVRKEANSVVNTVKKFLPEDNDKVNSVLNFITDKLDIADESSSKGPSAEEILKDKVNSELIAAMGEKQDILSTESLIQQQIEVNRNKTQLQVLNITAANTERLRKFSYEITNNYYRKSLEIGIKSLFINKELLEATKMGFDTFKNQLEGIVKNTALPDIIKIRSKEAIVAKLKNKTYEEVGNAFYNSSQVGNFKKNFKEKVGDIQDGLISKMSEGRDVLEMSAGMGDMGMSKSAMLAILAADTLKGKAGKLIGKQLDKNDDVREFMAKRKMEVGDLEATIKGTASGIENDTLSDLVYGLGDMFNDKKRQEYTIEKQDLKDATVFDNRAYSSLVKVIPGLLSKIYGELKSIRQPGTNPESNEILYDHKTSSFVNKESFKDNIGKSVTRQLEKGVGASINSIVSYLTSNGELRVSKEDKQLIKEALLSYGLSKKVTYKLEALGDKKFLDHVDKVELRPLIKNAVKKLINYARKNDLEIITTISDNLKTLAKESRKIDLKGDMQSLSDQGYDSVGTDLNITKLDSRTGMTKVNLEGLDDYIKKAYSKASDDNISRNLDDIEKAKDEAEAKDIFGNKKKKKDKKSFSKGGYTGDLPGYATGGIVKNRYTGDGDKNEPAGVVHKGEYVFTKEKVSKLLDNISNLDGKSISKQLNVMANDIKKKTLDTEISKKATEAYKTTLSSIRGKGVAMLNSAYSPAETRMLKTAYKKGNYKKDMDFNTYMSTKGAALVAESKYKNLRNETRVVKNKATVAGKRLVNKGKDKLTEFSPKLVKALETVTNSFTTNLNKVSKVGVTGIGNISKSLLQGFGTITTGLSTGVSSAKELYTTNKDKLVGATSNIQNKIASKLYNPAQLRILRTAYKKGNYKKDGTTFDSYLLSDGAKLMLEYNAKLLRNKGNVVKQNISTVGNRLLNKGKAELGKYTDVDKLKDKATSARDSVVSKLYSPADLRILKTAYKKGNYKKDMDFNTYISTKGARLIGEVKVKTLRDKVKGLGRPSTVSASRLKILRTEFFKSDEYQNGSITDFNVWLKDVKNIDIKTNTLSKLFSMVPKVSIIKDKLLKFKEEATEEILGKITGKGLKELTIEVEKSMRAEFFKTPEYKDGSVTDFDLWLKTFGYRRNGTGLLGRFKKKLSIKNILKTTRALDKKIAMGALKLAGKGTKLVGKGIIAAPMAAGRGVINIGRGAIGLNKLATKVTDPMKHSTLMGKAGGLIGRGIKGATLGVAKTGLGLGMGLVKNAVGGPLSLVTPKEGTTAILKSRAIRTKNSALEGVDKLLDYFKKKDSREDKEESDKEKATNKLKKKLSTKNKFLNMFKGDDSDGDDDDKGGKKTLLSKVIKGGKSLISPTMILLGIAAALKASGVTIGDLKKSFTKVGKTLVGIWETLKGTYNYTANLGGNITMGLKSLFSKVKIFGVDAPTKQELAENAAKNRGETNFKYDPSKDYGPGTEVPEEDSSFSKTDALAYGAAGLVGYKAVNNKLTRGALKVAKVGYKAAKGTIKVAGKVAGVTSKVAGAASKVAEVATKPKIKKAGIMKKLKVFLNTFKKKIIKKLGVKAGAKIIAKIAFKFLPFIGWAILGYDVIMIGKYLYDGYSFESAASKALIGFDLFGDDIPVDSDGEPVKVEPETDDYASAAMDEEDKAYASVTKMMNVRNAKNNRRGRGNRKNSRTPANNYIPGDKKKEPDTAEGDGVNVNTKVNDKTSTPKGTNIRTGALFDSAGGLDKLTLGKNVRIDGFNEKLSDNLASMANEYFSITGKSIPINSGYRSYEDQLALKKKYGAKAATPGKSTHEFGLAFDTNTIVADELDKLGLMKKYGFTRPVGKETWHVEAAGTQLDVNGSKEDAVIANNLIDASPGKGGEGWGTLSGVRKYSRDKNYQKELMSLSGTTTGDDTTDTLAKSDITTAAKASRSTLATAKTNVDKSGIKPLDVNKDKSTTIATNDKINLANNKDSNDNSKETISQLNNSNKTLSNSLSIQNQMLSVLGSINERLDRGLDINNIPTGTVDTVKDTKDDNRPSASRTTKEFPKPSINIKRKTYA